MYSGGGGGGSHKILKGGTPEKQIPTKTWKCSWFIIEIRGYKTLIEIIKIVLTWKRIIKCENFCD